MADKVGGDHGIFGVSNDTLELRGLGSFFQNSLDFLVGGRFCEANNQVHNRNVKGRDTEGKTASSMVNSSSDRCTKKVFHSRQLAIEAGNDLANSLGGTCAGGNDVVVNGTSTSPVFGRWAVDGLLGGRGSMDGTHETFDDAKFVVDDLGKRGKAVSGTGGVGDDGVFGVICIKVDTANEHGCVRGRCRDDDLFCTTFQVSTSPNGRYGSCDQI